MQFAQKGGPKVGPVLDQNWSKPGKNRFLTCFWRHISGFFTFSNTERSPANSYPKVDLLVQIHFGKLGYPQNPYFGFPFECMTSKIESFFGHFGVPLFYGFVNFDDFWFILLRICLDLRMSQKTPKIGFFAVFEPFLPTFEACKKLLFFKTAHFWCQNFTIFDHFWSFLDFLGYPKLHHLVSLTFNTVIFMLSDSPWWFGCLVCTHIWPKIGHFMAFLGTLIIPVFGHLTMPDPCFLSLFFDTDFGSFLVTLDITWYHIQYTRFHGTPILGHYAYTCIYELLCLLLVYYIYRI